MEVDCSTSAVELKWWADFSKGKPIGTFSLWLVSRTQLRNKELKESVSSRLSVSWEQRVSPYLITIDTNVIRSRVPDRVPGKRNENKIWSLPPFPGSPPTLNYFGFLRVI